MNDFYRILRISLVSLLVLAAVGCAQFRFPVNQRLDNGSIQAANPPSDDLLMVVTFSGGGTRAAALGYGVLEVLRETRGSESGSRLLDEIDLISGVSGGSFAAAYYGLYGDEIFQRFESDFLKRDVQSDAIAELFKPWNWFRLASPFYGRSELAADWLDKQFLGGATLAELFDSGGPRVHLNATDLTRGTYFPFTPEQFRYLCSDINGMRVARAVAASSAVPLVTNTVAVRNYAAECPDSEPEWVGKLLKDKSGSSRAYHEARRVHSYADSKSRPWIHLVDGGLSDNLGLRSVIGYLGLDLNEANTDEPEFTRRARKLIFVVVNAETRPDTRIDSSPLSPNATQMFKSATDVPINRYNFESILLLRERLARWEERRRAACADSESNCEDIDSYLIEVSFDAVQGLSLREFLFRVPTTLSLPPETVDQIRVTAAELVGRSPDFRRLVEDLANQQDAREGGSP